MKKSIITFIVFSATTLASETPAWTLSDASGYAYKNDNGWVLSDSTSLENNVFSFTNADNEIISFNMADGSTNRATYTFAVTLDLNALTLPSVDTSMVYGGSKVGFGLTSDGLITAAIGSGSPKWSSTGVIADSSGSLTLIVSTGAKGSIIAAYGDYSIDSTKENANNKGSFTTGTTTGGGVTYSWGGLKEGVEITSFTLNSDLASAVTGIAVWQNGTQSSLLSATTLDTIAGTMQTIPEPSTATLSLLALAGLAARRRRK